MKRNNKIFMLSVLFAMLAGLFHFLGNTANTPAFGRSVFVWMLARWNDYGGQYSHCYFIPLVSIWLLFRHRKQLLSEKTETDPRALILIIAALALHLISARTRLPRLALISLVALLWSIPWYIYGRVIARLTLFPCVFLLFCVPLTFLDSLTFPMRMFATTASASLLNGFGLYIVRRGTILIAPGVNNLMLEVADACSGLKYFVVLLTLAALYGYLTQKTTFKKWIIFICAAPIAVIANIVRIASITSVAYLLNTEIALHIYHDFSGYIVFITAVLCLMGTSKALNYNYRKVLLEWKKRLNHT